MLRVAVLASFCAVPSLGLRGPLPAAARAAAPRRASGLLDYTRPPPKLTLPGDTLETTAGQRAYVGLAALATAGVVAESLARIDSPAVAAFAVLGGLGGAELFSGAFHWATDNYGSLETPIFGEACAAFQGHHLAPWTITYRPTANNVFKICKAVAPLVLVAGFLAPPPLALALALTFSGQAVAQEFHKWAHVPPSAQPPLVRSLQRRGLAISVAEHCRHHRSPYADKYCILFGALNPLLDSSGAFRALERVVYERTGLEPNCWNEAPAGPAVRARALGLPPPPPAEDRAAADPAPAIDLEPYLRAATRDADLVEAG